MNNINTTFQNYTRLALFLVTTLLAIAPLNALAQQPQQKEQLRQCMQQPMPPQP